MGESELVFDWMWADEVKAHVEYYPSSGKVICEEYSDCCVFWFLGMMPKTFDSLYSVFESRCPSKDRPDIEEILEYNGVSGYNPVEWVLKTRGMMSHDRFWMRFKGEEHLTWDDVKTEVHAYMENDWKSRGLNIV